MAVEPTRQPHDDPAPPHAGSIRITSAPRTPDPEPEPDPAWSELLAYGTEEILKGTDTGTLVAFAALAFQQIRGKGEPHHGLGCSLLLFSVLMCALVHLAIGNDYVGRAKMMLRRKNEVRPRHQLIRRAWYGIAWMAAIVQIFTLVTGLGLILLEKPPALVLKYLGPLLQGP
jgi:ABC-type Fe3+ transport system permease subunit